jgi:hypothetical protein
VRMMGPRLQEARQRATSGSKPWTTTSHYRTSRHMHCMRLSHNTIMPWAANLASELNIFMSPSMPPKLRNMNHNEYTSDAIEFDARLSPATDHE